MYEYKTLGMGADGQGSLGGATGVRGGAEVRIVSGLNIRPTSIRVMF